MNKIPPRDGYGNALLKLAEKNDKFIVLDGDVAKSTRTNWIRDKYPEKFVDIGISEQDMVGTAAGLALSGMVPFATTYCVFLAGRAWDQVRTAVAYGDTNVKLAGAHAGINVGPDGASHQSMEDAALMRVLPNMTVVVPCDAVETEKAILAVADHNGPAFVRFGREAIEVITEEDTPFELGKARLVKDGSDLVIFANGPMVYQAMKAEEELAKEGISVMIADIHTIKPLDEEFIIAAAKKTGAVVTAEDHQKIGALGGAVCECLSENWPTPVIRVGMPDTFGESGKMEELMAKYGLDSAAIVKAAKKALAMKNR
ncbi:transketolase family protein [Clostridium sp. AM58-1XD]|nr:transketolase family protein [Clostridium sp. AM58-1XD]